MIKKITLLACIVFGFTGQTWAMDGQNPNAGNFLIPKKFTFEVGGGSSNVPVEHIISISPGTLFAVAGLLGLYQTASLLKEGIQKSSHADPVLQAEGKRILAYSGILLAGSTIAILSKLIPFLNK